MKTVIAFLLLLSIPCEILSFSAQSTTATINKRCNTQRNLILKAADDSKSDVGLLEPKQAVSTESPTQTNGAKAETDVVVVEEEEEEELSETKKLLKKVKQAGTAGAISYALWELGFWGVSLQSCKVMFFARKMHKIYVKLTYSALSLSLSTLSRFRFQSV